MKREGASADFEHKTSWMTRPLSTIANYAVFMRFHMISRAWWIGTRPIAIEMPEITQFSFVVLEKCEWKAGKSSAVWQLCIFFATPQRLRKIKINCLLLNLLSKSYLHFNAFQRLHSKAFVPCLTFTTHCCHFNSATSRKMQ